MAIKFAAALTRTTAKLWIKRIGRLRANFGTGRNWMNPASRWLRMGGGDCSHRDGNHNPQLTQITPNNERELATRRHKKNKKYTLICSCAFCASLWLLLNLRNLWISPSLRNSPQTQDHVFSDSHDQLAHSSSSTHTRAQSATSAYNLSHSQTTPCCRKLPPDSLRSLACE